MRDVLTGLAILLILLLTGATVAPHLIDWEARRGPVAEQISTAFGQRVEIDGPIGVTLLPVPTLKVGFVRLGDEGRLRGTIGRFRATLAVPPLLKGDIRITQAMVQGADLGLALDARPGGGSLPLAAIGFDRLTIRDSSLAILRADGTPALAAQRVAGDLEASSLLGPLRGSLGFDVLGAHRTLRFSTGRVENGVLRVRALMENEAAAVRTEYDGVLRLADGALAAEGALAASGNAAVPLERGTGHVIWRLAARLRASGAQAALDDVELALGNTDRQTVFTGNGEIDLARAERMAKVALSARQLDLDRLLTGEDPRLAQTPEATVRSLLKGLAEGADGRPWLSGDLELGVGSLLFGGETVLGPKLVLTAAGGSVGLGHLSAEFPGRTQLSFQGAPASGASLAGRLAFDSRDLGRLAAWYQAAPPRPLAVRSFKLDGDLRYGPNETRVLNAALVADEMRLNGSVQLLTGGVRPSLSLSLTADQLDIAKLPELPQGGDASAWDVDLAVDAKRIRYAGIGAGDITLRLRRQGEATLLDDLTIRDLDGANLAARGRLGGEAPRLDLRLQAKRMDAILQLADRLSVHWGIPLLASRAASLAPADLALAWAPEAGGERRLTAKGKLGETEIDGSARLTPQGGLAGEDALTLSLKASNPAILLRQAGLDAIPVATAGPVDLQIRGGGASARTPSVAWSVKGRFGGAEVDLAARETTSLVEPYSGRIRLSARDIAPLAQTLLVAVPAVTPGQDLALDAGFDLRGYRLTLRDLDIRSGRAAVKGELAFNFAEFGRVSGQLRMGRIDGSAIAPLVFGAPAADRALGWSRQPFGAAALATVPGDLWIEADTLDLGEGLAIQRPKFVLRFDNGLIFVEHAEGGWLDGRLTGQATLRRNEANVSVAARFGLENGRLDLLPLRTAEGGLRGRAAAQLEASAIGDSPAALVGALAGAGRLDIRSAAVAGLTPGALDGILRMTDVDFAAVTREALTANLERRLSGTIALPAGQTPLALAAGVLRAGPFRVPDGGGEITAQVAVDVKDFTLTARAGYVSRLLPKGWSGPAPSAEVMLRGPWGNPVREIDVSNLANGLTAIAIQREQERIEMLEQDQRERGFFNRRLRAAEEQRRAEEEERRRIEAERRALEEQKRREELARREAARQQLIQQRLEEAIRTAPVEPPAPPPLAAPPRLDSPAAAPGPPLSITPPAP